MSTVLQVNIAVPERSDAKHVGITGINKQPVTHPVAVSAPGPKGSLPPQRASGLAGDQIFDLKHHGGDDQAVYAYAREDYDWWEKELDRALPGGLFGENLTMLGVDMGSTEIGERWQIGDTLVLEATFGREPCATFQAKMGEPRWVKRFAQANRTGVYLRVVTPGNVQAGDPVRIVERPGHGVTIAAAFHSWLFDHETLPSYLAIDNLSETFKGDIRRRLRL
ncbi:MOSC domain-containing protein [Actinoplanes sp. N902-109]|uniref:MOSC domain-containing protein n=1 Tax=Actinoplanes sp. (strain N902-109) TaxID=649831 RepID=UPI0003294FF2|nr:MOSC domain-containing protein [Actinoplanes sp. N902-109]AGL14406.1 MOSC domain-containing protein [Actinoplanes sp. N902-109]